MRRLKRKYEKPLRPWDELRLEKEKEIMKNYGLKNKRELWRAAAILKKFRRLARELIANKDEKKEKILLDKLIKIGVLTEGATIDDVLDLTVENFLERRLQTIVFKKGLAKSIYHARQMIVHGHVAIENRKVVYPSYVVPLEEENKISVIG